MSSPFAITYIAVAVVTVAYLTTMHFLFERLMWQHSSVWEALGQPALFKRAGNPWQLMRFLVKREYLGLNDPVVTRLTILGSLLLVMALAGMALQFVFYNGVGS
jgi:hypothetical protein